MTTTATGLLCWRDLHPQERQLASLHLLDHLAGLQQNRLRHREAERLRGLDVDGHLKFDRKLDGQVGGCLAFQDAIDIRGGAMKYISVVGSV
jgi:hypothetical protein